MRCELCGYYGCCFVELYLYFKDVMLSSLLFSFKFSIDVAQVDEGEYLPAYEGCGERGEQSDKDAEVVGLQCRGGVKRAAECGQAYYREDNEPNDYGDFK